MSNFRIRIFQPIVPEYRKALFEGVGRRYGDRVEIWAAQGIGGQDVSYPLEQMHSDYSHPLLKFGPFVWQCGVSLKGLKKGDVVVICGDVHQLSSLWLAIQARMRSVRVVWWGHHRTSTSSAVAVAVRLALARCLSNVFLAYTRTGIAYLIAKGFTKGRVFATGNTIDQEPIRAACEEWTPDRMRVWQAERGLGGRPFLLCCSVMREKVHLEQVLKALTYEALNQVGLVVIGEGPVKERWMRLADDLKISNRVLWLGATRDQREMAPWFLSAQAFVYPGSIGLSILHSFSYGLPVITHGCEKHQMPEFEVMEDGKTGYCFRENNVDDLVQCLIRILSDESRRKNMADYCRTVAFERYSMHQMVENYCAALEMAAKI